MNLYTIENTVTLAKRHHNTKRSYLLVNPLQAKHLPVSPAKALQMMRCLGDQLAETCPEARLVIGFAETATAIAAAAAGQLGEGCRYIHTTRENYADLPDWICFEEEHSHAVKQKLYCKDLAEWIFNSPQLVLVDDEISTGKTLLNMVEQLKAVFPKEMKDKPIVAASILNRLSSEQERRFAGAGITSIFLVKADGGDLTDAVARFEITSPVSICTKKDGFAYEILSPQTFFMDPRLGVFMPRYKLHCQAIATQLSTKLSKEIPKGADVLVLGTEECMYPALILGQELEQNSAAASVRCHATTRSPIGICEDAAYPIHCGCRLRSFFDRERETYLYNLAYYDIVIIVTDTVANDSQARADIVNALRFYGCPKIIVVEGGCHV